MAGMVSTWCDESCEAQVAVFSFTKVKVQGWLVAVMHCSVVSFVDPNLLRNFFPIGEV